MRMFDAQHIAARQQLALCERGCAQQLCVGYYLCIRRFAGNHNGCLPQNQRSGETPEKEVENQQGNHHRKTQ